MDWSAVAIVLATILGPILAVWASEIRQRNRQAQDRKEWVFRTLMTTRSTRMSLDHVSALNHIDFAFPQDKHPQIGLLPVSRTPSLGVMMEPEVVHGNEKGIQP